MELFYLKFIAALLFVIGLLYGLAFLVRKLGLVQGQTGFAKSKRMQVKETLIIDSKNKVVLIELDQKEFLLSIHQNGVTPLSSPIPPKAAPASSLSEDTPQTDNTPSDNVTTLRSEI